jgi:hypothetical protein
MKIKSTSIALCAAAALTAATAWAEQQSSQSGGSQNQALSQAQAQEFFRASKIVGKSAQDTSGQKLGSIKEIVFNKQGEILALVDVGNDRWATVPWQLVNTESAKGNQNLTLNTTAQALKAAPAVTKDQWGALDNPSFTQGIYAYYHLQPPTQTGGASTPGGASQGQGSSEQQQQQQQQPK